MMRHPSSDAALGKALEAGGRVVFYEYCVSLIIFTLRRPSCLYYLPPGDRGVLRGLPYTLLSFFLGWWGVPWGILYTPFALLNNLSGGCDVTALFRQRFDESAS